MRSTAIAIVLLAAAPAAFAQTATSPVTGARPGNVIGTGNSLPFSRQASNIVPSDTGSVIAPRLPMPVSDANPTVLLREARHALAEGRTGLAQEAMEQAESLILNRSVPMSAAGERIEDPTVLAISEARHALGRGNVGRAQAIIADVLGRV